MHAKHPRGISHTEVRRSLTYACQTSAWDFTYGSSSEFGICMPNIRVGFPIRKFVGVWRILAKHPRGISHPEVRRSLAYACQTSAWDFPYGSSRQSVQILLAHVESEPPKKRRRVKAAKPSPSHSGHATKKLRTARAAAPPEEGETAARTGIVLHEHERGATAAVADRTDVFTAVARRTR